MILMTSWSLYIVGTAFATGISRVVAPTLYFCRESIGRRSAAKKEKKIESLGAHDRSIRRVVK